MKSNPDNIYIDLNRFGKVVAESSFQVIKRPSSGFPIIRFKAYRGYGDQEEFRCVGSKGIFSGGMHRLVEALSEFSVCRSQGRGDAGDASNKYVIHAGELDKHSDKGKYDTAPLEDFVEDIVKFIDKHSDDIRLNVIVRQNHYFKQFQINEKGELESIPMDDRANLDMVSVRSKVGLDFLIKFLEDTKPHRFKSRLEKVETVLDAAGVELNDLSKDSWERKKDILNELNSMSNEINRQNTSRGKTRYSLDL